MMSSKVMLLSASCVATLAAMVERVEPIDPALEGTVVDIRDDSGRTMSFKISWVHFQRGYNDDSRQARRLLRDYPGMNCYQIIAEAQSQDVIDAPPDVMNRLEQMARAESDCEELAEEIVGRLFIYQDNYWMGPINARLNRWGKVLKIDVYYQELSASEELDVVEVFRPHNAPMSDNEIGEITARTLNKDNIPKDANEKPRTCTICIADFKEGDLIRKLGCKHYFHQECIDKWLKMRPTCPNCKGSARDRPDIQGDENADSLDRLIPGDGNEDRPDIEGDSDEKQNYDYSKYLVIFVREFDQSLPLNAPAEDGDGYWIFEKAYEENEARDQIRSGAFYTSAMQTLNQILNLADSRIVVVKHPCLFEDLDDAQKENFQKAMMGNHEVPDEALEVHVHDWGNQEWSGHSM